MTINQERYAWYKSHGICTTCGRDWAEPGRVRCRPCEDKLRMYHYRNHEERIAQARARRQHRIETGMCTECGKRPATEGMRMCPRCRDMRNDSTRKYKIHQRTLKGERR